MTITNLTRRTRRLLEDQRLRRPIEQGFLFTREGFTVDDWSRLSAFLESIKQPARSVNWRELTIDQLDQIALWAYLQHENSLQHTQHVAIVRQWLDTTWSSSVAALLDLVAREQGGLAGLPYAYAFHSEIQQLSTGRDNLTTTARQNIRRYLLQREQGIDYEPCIYR